MCIHSTSYFYFFVFCFIPFHFQMNDIHDDMLYSVQCQSSSINLYSYAILSSILIMPYFLLVLLPCITVCHSVTRLFVISRIFYFVCFPSHSSIEPPSLTIFQRAMTVSNSDINDSNAKSRNMRNTHNINSYVMFARIL